MDPVSTVRAGMELLAWEYDDDTWQELITKRRAHRRTLGATAEELDQLDQNPKRVLFTSTGILRGKIAWPWRTRRRYLSHIELIFGGWRALQFTFQYNRGLRSEQLLIPLPPALATDAIAMAKEDLLPRAARPELIIIGAEGPELPLFNPTTSDDPVARAIQWHAINPGGADYRTHDLVRVSPDRMELRTPAWHRATGIIVASTGLVAGGAAALAAAPVLAAGLAGVACLGVWMIGRRKSVVFDRTRGFWSGDRKGPSVSSWVIDLNRIYALQLVSEVTAAEQTYVSWELNLVLDDGERVNVLDHADWSALHDHAHALAKFLGVPLWKGV